MVIIQKEYDAFLKDILHDNTKKRFNTIIILTNNISQYFSLVEYLESKADITVRISEEPICSGKDTIPNMKAVLPILDSATDKNILITSVGEYLRIGKKVEKANRCLYSIISHQAHSTKRVWIPIFAAKEEFFDVIGELDEEHYPQVVYEIEGEPSGFETTIYANSFSDTPSLFSANGIRTWLSLWDNGTVKTGMSFNTRHYKQIDESDGIYTLRIISDSFHYLQTLIGNESVKINPDLGTDEQWLFLATKAEKQKTSIAKIIEKALNVLSFDPHQILSRWTVISDDAKWAFWLYYKLKLNTSSDYISYALTYENSWRNVPECIELAIFNCLDNPLFDEWVKQYITVQKELGVSKHSQIFWDKFDSVKEIRKKLKLLSNQTPGERAKIIEICSYALKNGKTLDDYESLLKEKYPDLLLYLSESEMPSGELTSYINNYKQLKIKDVFSLDFSDSAEKVNIYEFDTRSQILGKIKNTREAYYLWIDGMGIEWIDLLVKKIADQSSLKKPEVSIGTAVLPTVTSVNMACADQETVSQKLNDFDSVGHIKDKSDCNYYSVIEKQIELINSIAEEVSRIASVHSSKDIVITSDHGMSRHAAKGFHALEGIDPSKNGNVCSLGRYCEYPTASVIPDISHTVKNDNILAFKNHSHFKVSGYAPGEIHGGASPEEILVPVIHYRREKKPIVPSKDCSYSIDSTITISGGGDGELQIRTKGRVDKVMVEIQTERIVAEKVCEGEWIAKLHNLKVDSNYVLRVYLNNLYSLKEEKIYVKAAGLSFDSDFDF